MDEFTFGDWNTSPDKHDMHIYTVLLNVLIHWYNSEIKEIDVENFKVDFTIDDSLIDDQNFMNSGIGNVC